MPLKNDIIQQLLTPKQFSTPVAATTMSYVPSHETICTIFLQSEHCSGSAHWELFCDMPHLNPSMGQAPNSYISVSSFTAMWSY